MNAVVVDALTRNRLLEAGDDVVVRDESGAVIGRFTKLTRVGEHFVEGDWPTDDELDRRVREGQRFSAAEVDERLRKLKESVG